MSILKDSDGKFYVMEVIGGYMVKVTTGFATLREAEMEVLARSVFVV